MSPIWAAWLGGASLALAKGHLWKYAETAPARYQVQLHLQPYVLKQSDILVLPTLACSFVTPFFLFSHSFIVAMLCFLGAVVLVTFLTAPLTALLFLRSIGLQKCLAIGWLIQVVGFSLSLWGAVIAWRAD